LQPIKWWVQTAEKEVDLMDAREKKPGMFKSNIIAIIQARMGSSRLPGKVLKNICGRPMLEWVVQRAKRSTLISELVVAITSDPLDDVLEGYCQDQSIPYFRGSSADVLDRYIQAARKFHADVIVRLTADCPFIDPDLIDQTLSAFFKSGADFAANRLPPPYHRTFPIGLDVEVASMSALEKTWENASALFEREHVMPYIYQHLDLFRIKIIDYFIDYGAYRWTVDTNKDLEFIQAVANAMDCGLDFSWLDVIELLKAHPDLMKINAQVKHKSFTDVDERVREKRRK
jgi:spore coat polysaccharide biosynthesis protein SpsF